MSEVSEILELKARGKLMLTAEYLVLDGAQALAIPLKAGQTMRFTPQPYRHHLRWTAYEPNGKVWVNTVFDIRFPFHVLDTTDKVMATRLQMVLRAAQVMREGLEAPLEPGVIETQLEFDPRYGWGSSSTLLHIVSQWLGVDAYNLLDATFGGSGYDIACADAESPILFSRNEEGRVAVQKLNWTPPQLDHWYLVWLGAKQNSRTGISRYRGLGTPPAEVMEKVAAITQDLLEAEDLATCQMLFTVHERILADVLHLIPIKEALFNDFNGSVKSLGAWGGDFVLALSADSFEDVQQYFQIRGFDTVLPAKDWFQL